MVEGMVEGMAEGLVRGMVRGMALEDKGTSTQLLMMRCCLKLTCLYSVAFVARAVPHA